MKKKILIMSLICASLLCVGCKNKVELKDGKEVVGSVKGKKITAEELFDEMKKTYGANTLTSMIDDFITSKEIKDDSEANEKAKAQIEQMKAQYEQAGYEWSAVLSQYGYTSDEDLIKDYANDYKKTLVVKKYVKKDITDDEINEYYEKEIYGNYTVKHILIKPDIKDDASDEDKEKANEKAKETAKEVIKKLDNGEKWADLVKKYSDDTASVKDEGLIKDFTKGDVVDEFFNATLDLKDGKYTKEPIESTYGYHVILKVSNTKKPNLNKVKNKVMDAIAENKLNNDEKLSTETWKKVRDKYNLKISDSTIKSAYNKANS